jgi:hypothetical protein
VSVQDIHHFGIQGDYYVVLENISNLESLEHRSPNTLEHRSLEASEKYSFKDFPLQHLGDLECVEGETYQARSFGDMES